MKEDVKIQSTNSGSTSTRTISDVNPAATNIQLATLGTMLTDLTTNTYVKTDRVTTVNCDTEPGGGVKPTPTLTLSQSSIRAIDISNSGNGSKICSVTTNSDGNVYVRNDAQNANQTYLIFRDNAGDYWMYHSPAGTGNVAQTIYFGVTETDNFASPPEVAFQITA